LVIGSDLTKQVIEAFAPRFAPGSVLIYAGDTGDKWGYFDAVLLAALGVMIDSHGKMPDVVQHYPARNWLLLVETVTSHGPVDGKRQGELAQLFSTAAPGLVYVTAFPSRSVMARYLGEIAWETEVWVADAPSHLIHFNGERFLGPYDEA
jgi:adenine-specific DNA-methyltransferase